MAAANAVKVRRGPLAVLSLTHLANDFYTGAVPGLVPFFVALRDYSYASVSGLILASTLLSSIIQPLFGVVADRWRLSFLIPIGMLVSAAGVSLVGLVHPYLVTCLMIGISGLGVAAYHPEATRSARLEAGASASGMSVFSVGGNVGIALGPLAAALVLDHAGLSGTPYLMLPALCMAVIYLVVRTRDRAPEIQVLGHHSSRESPQLQGRYDDWRSFRVLIAIVIARSIGTTGINAFLALDVIKHFHRSASFGAIALTVLSSAGIMGTLLGGWLADRVGRGRALRLGYLIAPAMLAGVIAAPSLDLAMACIALLGITSYIPFSVQVVLGQEYLATRIGTASGVTLGLGITAGGLFAPLFGLFADAVSLQATLWVGVVVLAMAFVLSLRLSDPRNRLALN